MIIFKHNPLICCFELRGDIGNDTFGNLGNRDSFGGGSSLGGDKASNGSISDLNNDLQTMNSQSSVNFANDLVSVGEQVQRETGWSIAKSMGAVAAGLVTGNISIGISALKSLGGVTDSQAELVADLGQQLVNDHNLNNDRLPGIKDAIASLSSSQQLSTDDRNLSDESFRNEISNVISSNISSQPTGIPDGVDNSGIPSTIPENIRPGLAQFTDRSDAITSDFNTRSNQIWDNYLDFEQFYFGENQAVRDQFDSDIGGLPKLNLQLPEAFGGATVPLAPKVHSALATDQANTRSNLIGNQANTALAGIGSRNALNQNAFNVNQVGLSNSFLPTQTALDLFKMERAGQLGIANTQAGLPKEPSTLSKFAPVVGSLLSPNGDGGTNLSSIWDFITG